MKPARITFILLFFTAFLGIFRPAYAQAQGDSLPKLIVFHSATCHRCIEVKSTLMPKIEEEFKNKVEIEYRDIADIENYKLLVALQEKYGLKGGGGLPVFYLQGHFLRGEEVNKESLKEFIKDYAGISLGQKIEFSAVDLAARFKSFKPLAVVGAGLIDGINPCAFTVIVFFISFLALQGYRKRELAVIGLSFIFAVFLTYLLIGLGLFEFLYRLKGFWLAAKVINICIGAFSFILGILCLYDFFKFKRTKDTEGLLLQLPKSVKNQIHKVIGAHYRVDKRPEGGSAEKKVLKLVLSAFITGFLVSILEAVCTGQVYLPTISFVLKTTNMQLHALGYLLLYNLMFVIPLLIVFFFALLGATSGQFANFLKKYLGAIKILMALLFFGLGTFLIWRG